MTDVKTSNPLAQWFTHWNKPLQRLLRRHIKHIDPEDLSQEVYLRLLRVKDLDAIREPKGYLYRMACNIAIEWRARGPHTHPHTPEGLDELIELTTPEAEVGAVTDERALNAALRQMPVLVRGAVYLKLREDKSHQEIAVRLGVSTRAVRKLLTEGYSELHHKLVKERFR